MSYELWRDPADDSTHVSEDGWGGTWCIKPLTFWQGGSAQHMELLEKFDLHEPVQPTCENCAEGLLEARQQDEFESDYAQHFDLDDEEEE